MLETVFAFSELWIFIFQSDKNFHLSPKSIDYENLEFLNVNSPNRIILIFFQFRDFLPGLEVINPVTVFPYIEMEPFIKTGLHYFHMRAHLNNQTDKNNHG